MLPHRDDEWSVLLGLFDLGGASASELLRHLAERGAPIDHRLVGAALMSFERSGLVAQDPESKYQLTTPIEDVVRQAAEHFRDQLDGRPELLSVAVRVLGGE